MSEENEAPFIKKLGLYMTEDLEYAAFIDNSDGKKKPLAFFKGRSFLASCISLICLLDEEVGSERLKKFLSGEKLQK